MPPRLDGTWYFHKKSPGFSAFSIFFLMAVFTGFPMRYLKLACQREKSLTEMLDPRMTWVHPGKSLRLARHSYNLQALIRICPVKEEEFGPLNPKNPSSSPSFNRTPRPRPTPIISSKKSFPFSTDFWEKEKVEYKRKCHVGHGLLNGRKVFTPKSNRESASNWCWKGRTVETKFSVRDSLLMTVRSVIFFRGI